MAQSKLRGYRPKVSIKPPKERDDAVLVPKERVISMGRGCYNCRWWSREAANPLWTDKRQGDLKNALELLMQLPYEPKTIEDAEKLGPIGIKFFQTRSMIDSLDHLVASGHAGVCRGGGKTANGNPVGDFTLHSLYCQVWSGVSGASLATEGHKPDLLPEELNDKLNKTWS